MLAAVARALNMSRGTLHTNENLAEMIREAILRKRIVVATYRNHRRLMCPHTLGWKNGREHALLYQFNGTSDSGLGSPGSTRNWRCVFVDELENVLVQDGDWHTCTIHTRPQTCVDIIDVEVGY